MFPNKVADQAGRTDGMLNSEFSPEMIRDASSPSRLGSQDMRSSDMALNITGEKVKISDSKKHV